VRKGQEGDDRVSRQEERDRERERKGKKKNNSDSNSKERTTTDPILLFWPGEREQLTTTQEEGGVRVGAIALFTFQKQSLILLASHTARAANEQPR
jgi:hypothetical protein